MAPIASVFRPPRQVRCEKSLDLQNRPSSNVYVINCIIDLDSLNGTFVNDHRLTPEVPHSLHPNEQIRFGQNTSNPGTTFTYEVTGAEPVEPTRIAPPVPPISKPAILQARSRPAIRDIIAGQTNYEPSSDNELVDLLASLAAALLPGATFSILMKGAAILFKAVGGQVTNRLKKVFPGPYEYTAIVLAFRKTELAIISLYDTAYGSVIEGKLPSSLISFGDGTITIEFIDESPASITVDVTAEIKGEDWGKGKHAI